VPQRAAAGEVAETVAPLGSGDLDDVGGLRAGVVTGGGRLVGAVGRRRRGGADVGFGNGPAGSSQLAGRAHPTTLTGVPPSRPLTRGDNRNQRRETALSATTRAAQGACGARRRHQCAPSATGKQTGPLRGRRRSPRARSRRGPSSRDG